MDRIWTEEDRRKQAEQCRTTQPWAHSTGPKTTEGKRKIAQNALKHGLRSVEARRLEGVLGGCPWRL